MTVPNDLFRTYRARPVRAIQLTAENAAVLGELPGLRYEPETDEAEMLFGVQIDERHSIGIELGDWIIGTETEGLWSIASGAPEETDGLPAFNLEHETDSTLDVEAVDKAIRSLISILDYDMYKSIAHDEEDGSDGFPTVTNDFIGLYNQAVQRE